MGLSLSYPLATEPESYVDPDYDEESDAMNFGKELHEITLSYCYDMIEHRIRSFKEEAKFQKFSHTWSKVVEDWKKNYPEWTSNDFLNLKQQFVFFDTDGDRLLCYQEFCEALDLMNFCGSEEERRALFDQADLQNYKSVSFENYLQFMYEIKKGMPIHKPPEKDQQLTELVNDVSQMDPFRQMCYGVF